MTVEVSLVAAFLAGLLSISSPCVLPLVPLYLTHLVGVSVNETGGVARSRVLANAMAYVLGFSLVFILLGVALGAAGDLAATASIVAGNRFWLVRIGGILLILLGLHQIGLIRLPLLDRERRLQTGTAPAGGLTSSFFVGVTFGAGWSPCVGPILGAILTMAAGQGSIERAALLLAIYSLGLAIPFMLVAAFGAAPGIIRRIQRRLYLVSGLSGGVMLAVGALMLLGFYQQFFARLVAISPWIPWEPTL
ncbi:MAG: sulfite exporter TauE/SafE family protein [Chloroflexia bacterium]|nr:sulfite exporter TauE/SafE family protein [Chloroflexia bacterium]